MDIQENVSLRDHSTMRLGGTARYLVTITERHQIGDAVAWAKDQNVPFMMIGGGSNIIWRDEGYPGLIIVNQLLRYEDFAEDELNHYITVGAGEPWDSVVERTVAAGLTGIECLSLIPGTTGGTPVQNVGAYGQEIADTLMSVEAYDSVTGQMINIPASDCDFAYRTSRFKGKDKGRYLISAITLHLTVGKPMPPFYASLASRLEEQHISDPTPAQVREAVIAIRQSKLPDPAVVANNGSFFANPIIDAMVFFELTERLDELGAVIPHWEMPDGSVKIAAAWLVEQAGFKGVEDAETGMATWKTQSIVLINEHAQSTADLLKFRQKILDAVEAKFGIVLEQEPELLP